MKRAIVMGGGGPAAGLHIGALKCFQEAGIKFDVWALSCVGVWVGTIYNSFDDGDFAEQTEAYFRDQVFRSDKAYEKFPISPSFPPDIRATTKAMMQYWTDPKSYEDLWAPEAIDRAAGMWKTFLTEPSKWQTMAFNQLMLETAAANPMTRFMTSMMWKSGITGLSMGTNDGEPGLGKSFEFDNIYKPGKPYLYHNAWNLTKKRMDYFSNGVSRPDGIKAMTHKSMYACSALPFAVESVEIDGDVYCEGALVDTVEFHHLLDDHKDLDEVWVLRIVDPKQASAPENLTDSFSNLAMIFAGALGEANVEAFVTKVRGKKGIDVYDVKVSHNVNFDWNYSNLDLGIKEGFQNAARMVAEYKEKGGGK